MIEYLIEADIESNLKDTYYMRERLLLGWTGYSNMSDDDIEREYKRLTE